MPPTLPERLRFQNGYMVDPSGSILLAERDLRTEAWIDRAAFMEALVSRYNREPKLREALKKIGEVVDGNWQGDGAVGDAIADIRRLVDAALAL